MKFSGKSVAIITMLVLVFVLAAYFFKDEVPNVKPAPALMKQGAGNQKQNPPNGKLQEQKEKNKELTKISKSQIMERLDVVLGIPEVNNKSKALEDLAKKSADNGYLNIALNIAQQITDTKTKSSTLSYVSYMAAKAGDLELAVKIAEKVPGSTTASN